MAVSTSPSAPAEPVTAAVESVPRPRRATTAGVLLAGLLLVVLLAASTGGASGRTDLAWVQTGLVLLALVAATGWLGSRRLRPAASVATVAGLVALAALAAWAAASLTWSVAPDRSWTEANRVLAYVVAGALGVVVGSTLPRARARVAQGFVAVTTLVALWALAGKVLPGVVEHATEVARLRAPLDAPSLLGIVCAFGALLAVRLAAQPDGSPRGRTSALVALLVLLSTLALTYSRGALLALAAGLVVLCALPGPRLRGLAAFALAALAAAPVVVLAFSVTELRADAVATDERVEAGLLLGVVVVGMAVLLAAAGRFLIGRESVRGGRERAVWLGLAGLVALLAAAGVVAMAAAPGGVDGTLDRATDEFTTDVRDAPTDPERLLSTSSDGRWAWWSEALGAFADEPVHGWGASAFPVARRLYRESPVAVEHAHSLPLGWLADLGAVGAGIGAVAIVLLVTGAAARVRALAPGRERDLAGALLAAAVAVLVHALVDPDWSVPAVVLPALVALGVAGARSTRARPVLVEAAGPEGGVGRVLGLVAVALVLAAALVSAWLPAWSQARTDDALAATGQRSQLEDAAADAALAARLDPTAVRPLLAQATIASARERPLEARAFLLEAVERQPSSVTAWLRLSELALQLADREGARRAVLRALALDPADRALARRARSLQAVVTPPEASATATGTPLPPPPTVAPITPVAP
jgi:hypothetical protein